MNRTEARIANRREDMELIVAMVEEFGVAHGLAKAELHDLNVAIDEVVSNIIAYAYEQGEHGEIVVRLTHHPDEVLADIEDAGRAFDPTRFPPPDLRGTLKERRVGGVGIHFVRELMDEVIYSRDGSKNRLRLRKKLPHSNNTSD